MSAGCCAPGRGQGATAANPDRVPNAAAARVTETPDQRGMVTVEGGRFVMGSDDPTPFPGMGRGRSAS